MRGVVFVAAILLSTNAHAACLGDLGRREAPFAAKDQLVALAHFVGRGVCKVYALHWLGQESSGERTRNVLLFSRPMAAVIRASFVEGRREQTFSAESWSAVSRQGLISEPLHQKVDARFHTRLKPGQVWIVDELTAAFLAQNRLDAFLGDDFLATFSQSEEDAELAEQAEARASIAAKASRTSAPPLPARPAAIAQALAQGRCLRGRDEGAARPSPAASTAGLACPSALPAEQKSGSTPAAVAAAPPADLTTSALPRAQTDAGKEADPEAATEAIEQRLTMIKDLEQLRKMAQEIPIADVRQFWLEVIEDKEHRLELCQRELERLGIEPTPAARRFEEDCDWQLFWAKSRKAAE